MGVPAAKMMGRCMVRLASRRTMPSAWAVRAVAVAFALLNEPCEAHGFAFGCSAGARAGVAAFLVQHARSSTEEAQQYCRLPNENTRTAFAYHSSLLP